MEFLRQTIRLFQIRKEERPAAIIATVVFTILNALNVAAHFGALSSVGDRSWKAISSNWHLSGFDPITYSVMTDWESRYNIYRHPLLAYFVWPFSKLNEALMATIGVNCATIITALLLVFFATYSFIFLSRIFWEIIGTRRSEAYILSVMNFSFAFVMLATLVPDHFCPSMFCLIMTLYLCGRKLQRGRALNWWQTILMFFFTAGISLNNGLKVFLAALVTRGKTFFRPKYLIIAVILPAALMWEGACLSYKYLVWPREMAAKQKAKENREAQLKRQQSSALATVDINDTVRVAHVKDSVKRALEAKRIKRKHMSAFFKHTGKPISKGEFMGWTDITTNRWDIATESLFGEGIMAHEDYLLGDVLVNRPVIVRYHNWFNYIVEGVLVMLFFAGIWCGSRMKRFERWKKTFLWATLSFFLMDMALHLGLGFGINEMFIMSAHYLFALPVAMGYLLLSLNDVRRRKMTLFLCAVDAYLVIWNVTMLVEYLYFL